MFHQNLLPGDQHVIHQWVVANAAALAALTPISSDVGKVAYQSDTKVFYILEDVTPTWGRLNIPQAELDSKQTGTARLVSLAGLSYAGNALKSIRVNAAEDGFEIGIAASSGGAYTVADAAPTPTSNGEKWLNSINGKEYTWIIDGDTSQWVELGPVAAASNQREVLTADRTYYVSTTGSDSNNGLGSGPGAAFLTIQRAVDAVYLLDLGIHNATIQIADGTYTGGIALFSPIVGKGVFTIQGNAGTPANVSIATTGLEQAILVTRGAVITLKDLKIANTGSFGLMVSQYGVVRFSNLVFGAVAAHQIRVEEYGDITATGNYTIISGCAGHIYNTAGWFRAQSLTITLTGSPAFSGQFIGAGFLSNSIMNGCTFSGSATGPRYAASFGAIIYGGGGPTYFPGNSAGSVATGGQYA